MMIINTRRRRKVRGVPRERITWSLTRTKIRLLIENLQLKWVHFRTDITTKEPVHTRTFVVLPQEGRISFDTESPWKMRKYCRLCYQSPDNLFGTCKTYIEIRVGSLHTPGRCLSIQECGTTDRKTTPWFTTRWTLSPKISLTDSPLVGVVPSTDGDLDGQYPSSILSHHSTSF